MTTAEQIKVLCVRKNISLSELARKIDESPQNFSSKLKRNTITDNEIEKICEQLNVKYRKYFALPNGEVIE